MAALNNHYFKLLIVGDSNVGKSCLLFRFVNDVYSDSLCLTVGKSQRIILHRLVP